MLKRLSILNCYNGQYHMRSDPLKKVIGCHVRTGCMRTGGARCCSSQLAPFPAEDERALVPNWQCRFSHSLAKLKGAASGEAVLSAGRVV